MRTPAERVYRAPSAADRQWQRLLEPLREVGIDLEASAREHGALRRRRAVGSAADLLRLVLGYALEEPSLRATCLWAVLSDLADLSAVALGRWVRQSADWLGYLVGMLVTDARLAGLRAPLRLRLVDATLAERGRLRAHVSFDLGRETLDALELTERADGESLRRHTFAPGDLVVADAGYSHPGGLAHAQQQGAQLIVRFAWQTLPLRAAATGPRLDGAALVEMLAGLGPRARLDLQVLAPWRDGPPLALRLVGCRLPPEQAQQRRRRLRRQARKKGRTPPRWSLQLADWLLLVTDLPCAGWLPETVLALYRLRWQVELAFKRLKSVWRLDRLPRGSAALARSLVLARLLLALLAERAAGGCLPTLETWAADPLRPLSRWRWQRLLHQSVVAAVLSPLCLADLPALLPRLRRHLCGSAGRRGHQAASARDALATLLALDLPSSRCFHAA